MMRPGTLIHRQRGKQEMKHLAESAHVHSKAELSPPLSLSSEEREDTLVKITELKNYFDHVDEERRDRLRSRRHSRRW